MHIREHLKTVNRHRRLVRRYCFKLGLYWQGLTHDLSKYSPTEFWRSAKYYQGFRSPNDQERSETGVSLSWLHHKGRNRHHFEYWIDYRIARDGTVSMGGCKMPKNTWRRCFATVSPPAGSIRAISIPMPRPMIIFSAPRGGFGSMRRPPLSWAAGSCC